ncbi:hypothetical protein K488DRAFT_57368 [Vararia minispora EC-137]|uniref:Uncharacterized protein n=1 Tax=Vararia minispora EC-137 TaxID=1314806 RepID=A0ACB8QB11_9AGAM|nr:hypothetical protein K488DRAFT_57368 [Vararia minispora EC-137]
MTSAFFYGTLMHPKILKRVIGNDGSHLFICPAVLLGYTRHNVKDADYPGIVPYKRSKKLIGRELSFDEKSVRGTLVSGLTASDMHLLDVFEGNEYVREDVSVHPLSDFAPLAPNQTTPITEASFVPTAPPPLPAKEELPSPVSAGVYVWSNPLNELHPELWSFETFVRDNAWKWIGEGAEDNEDYKAVDDVRWEGRPTP